MACPISHEIVFIRKFFWYFDLKKLSSCFGICLSPTWLNWNPFVMVLILRWLRMELKLKWIAGGDDSAVSQSGIVSCIAVNPGLPSVYAAGSYMKSIGDVFTFSQFAFSCGPPTGNRHFLHRRRVKSFSTSCSSFFFTEWSAALLNEA